MDKNILMECIESHFKTVECLQCKRSMGLQGKYSNLSAYCSFVCLEAAEYADNDGADNTHAPSALTQIDTGMAQLDVNEDTIPISKVSVPVEHVVSLTDNNGGIVTTQTGAEVVADSASIPEVLTNKPQMVPGANASSTVTIDQTPYSRIPTTIPTPTATTSGKVNPLFAIPACLRKANIPIVPKPATISPHPLPDQSLTTGKVSTRKVYMVDDCSPSPAIFRGLNLHVPFIYDGSRIHVFSKTEQDGRNRIQTEINTQHHFGKLQRLEETPIVGEILVGNFDGEYYRALVREVNMEKKEAIIESVDFGDDGISSFQDLYIPNETMMNEPLYGMAIKLYGIPDDSRIPIPDILVWETEIDSVKVSYVGEPKYNGCAKIDSTTGPNLNELVLLYLERCGGMTGIQ